MPPNYITKMKQIKLSISYIPLTNILEDNSAFTSLSNTHSRNILSDAIKVGSSALQTFTDQMSQHLKRMCTLRKHFAGESIAATQNGFVNLHIKTGNFKTSNYFYHYLTAGRNICFTIQGLLSSYFHERVYLLYDFRTVESETGNVVDFV